MYKSYYGIAIFFLVLAAPAFPQSILWQESFETDGEGIRYLSSNTFHDGSNDHFRVTNGSDISIEGGFYSEYEGLFFWAGEDLDDVGDPANNGHSTKEVSFKAIKTSGYTNLQFYGLFAAGNDGLPGSNSYDDEDSVVVYYSTDGGNSFDQALKFASTGDQSNEPLALDSDLDGIGDSIVLSPVMQEFSFAIPDADTVQIKISISMNAGSEEFAFDDFRLGGSYDGSTPLHTTVSFTSVSDTTSESAGGYLLPVHIKNPSDTVAITIQVEGDSVRLSSFEKEVSIVSEKDSVILFGVEIMDNENIDGLSKATIKIINVEGGYSAYIKEPATFTLFLRDDDEPEGGEVIISEIMYDSKSSVDEEWVELFNTTALPINISGWYLTDDDSYPADEEGDVVIPEGSYINPGEYLVVSWKDLTDFDREVILEKNTGNRSYAPGLANNGDNIALYSNAIGTGRLVDGSASLSYADAVPANAGYSIEQDIKKGYSGEWSGSVNNYSGLEIIRGTPGAVNSNYYTKIYFDLPQYIVSEGGNNINLPLKIMNPSDTTDSSVEIILIEGDSNRITNPAFQRIKFPAGTASQDIEIGIKDDSLIGNSDTLLFKLQNASGGLNSYITSDSLFQLVITDNDFTQVNFELDSLKLKEGDSIEINFIVTNPHPELSTFIELENEAVSDLELSDKNFEIAPGKALGSFFIKAIFDGVEEGMESIKIKMAEVSGGNEAYIGADSSAVVHIEDVHPTVVSFLHASDTVFESISQYEIPIIIANPSPDSATSVTVRLVSGDKNDFAEFQEEEIIFDTGAADTSSFTITIVKDSIREGDEEFVFQLIDVKGGYHSRLSEADKFILSIVDDEEGDYNLVFNEILFDPPADTIEGDANKDGNRSSIEDEFIEVVNQGPMSVDISGFTINDASAIRHIFPDKTIVAPMQGVIVFGGGLPTGDFGGSLVQIASSGRLSLNNGGDNVFLITRADTIKSLSYSGSLGNDQSITRSPDITGDFVDHLSASEQLFSPGFQANGFRFDEELPDPYLEIDTTAFKNDFGAHYFSDTSGISSYGFKAGNLQDTLRIKAPAGFYISMDKINWFSEENALALFSEDSLSMQFFVRFIPSTSENKDYTGIIMHSTKKFDTLFVPVFGQGKEKPEPKISTSYNLLDFGLIAGNKEETVFNYQIKGSNLVDTLFIIAPENFLISSDGKCFVNEIGLPPNAEGKIDATIYVKFSGKSEGVYESQMMHRSAWLNEVAVIVKAEYLQPVLELSLATINFDVVINDDHAIKGYTIKGHSLAGAVEVHSPGGTFLSVTEDFSNAKNHLTLYPDESRGISGKIFVRYNPASDDVLADDIIHISEGADTAKIFVEGEFLIPIVEIDKPHLEFKERNITEDAKILSYTISASSILNEIQIISPPGFELALEDNFREPANSIVLIANNRKVNQEVFVRFHTISTGIFNDSIRHITEGAKPQFIRVSGESVNILSINNNRSDKIKVYPIPADNFIYIQTETNVLKTIRLLDIFGRELLSADFVRNIILEVSRLKSGIYYVHISTTQEIKKLKIVIVH